VLPPPVLSEAVTAGVVLAGDGAGGVEPPVPRGVLPPLQPASDATTTAVPRRRALRLRSTPPVCPACVTRTADEAGPAWCTGPASGVAALLVS